MPYVLRNISRLRISIDISIEIDFPTLSVSYLRLVREYDGVMV